MKVVSCRKILHLIAPTHYGGAEKIVIDIANNIDKNKFEIIIGSFINIKLQDNLFLKKLRQWKIKNKIFWLKRTVDIENVFKLIYLIRKQKIDLIHTHGYRSDIIGMIAAKITRTPFVSTVHGWVAIDEKLKLYGRLDRLVLKFFDKVIVVTDQIKNDLIVSGIKNENITRLYNAIDIRLSDLVSNILNDNKRIDKNKTKTVGIIGRLSPEKDIPTFLESAAILTKKYENIIFHIAGDGPERKKLEKIVKEYNIEKNIKFLGFLNKVDDFYSKIDALVICSLTEGIPMVMLEAMNYGVPVVATRVGGLKEVIDHGINGLLVNTKDSSDLADKIDKVLNENEIRIGIIENSYKKLKIGFCQTAWINSIESIYERMLTK